MPLVHNNFGVVQGFAPTSITTATNLATTNVLAIRINSPVSYQINGAGTSATMPAGVTIIDPSVTSILFSVSTTVELMSKD